MLVDDEKGLLGAVGDDGACTAHSDQRVDRTADLDETHLRHAPALGAGSGQDAYGIGGAPGESARARPAGSRHLQGRSQPGGPTDLVPDDDGDGNPPVGSTHGDPLGLHGQVEGRHRAILQPGQFQGGTLPRAVDGGEPPLGQQPGPAVPVTQRRPQPTGARGGIPYREDDTGGLLSPGQTQQA